jgi:nucleoside 2-deoxyribosyltransferase
VYIAAPLGEQARARAARESLTAAGLHVVSTWHERVAAGEPEPEADEDREYAAKSCARELARAQVLLAMTNQGVPRGTFVEVGMALAMAIPVFWLVPRETNDPRGTVFDSHPYVTRAFGYGELEAAILRFARQEPDPVGK